MRVIYNSRTPIKHDPLDDGISQVTLIDYMGDDLRVVNAARVSFDKESSWVEDPRNPDFPNVLSERDRKLIRYLARHDHWTPFSHCMVTLRIKMPIFVARQWFKHSVGFTRNEVSRRYVDSTPEFYVPKIWRKRAENVKQGSSDETVILDGSQKCAHCGSEMEFKRKEDEKMKRFCSARCRDHHYRKHTHKGWAVSKVASLRQSAKKRGIAFDLTVEDLLEVGQPAVCKYLGIELDYAADSVKPESASVNRIDPRLGYVKGNIEIISNKANSMLLDATPEELMTFVENVALVRNGVFVKQAPSVRGFYDSITETYNKMIAEGIAPEQARMILPCSHYTEFYETGSLAAYARLAKLRLDSHAQKETRLYAEAVSEIMARLFPVSWEALSHHTESK